MRYNHESYLPLGAFQPTLGKMKLFGGGGGGILDDISDTIGTGGGDQGLLNAIDEGVQSVGSGLAEVDDFVNEEIPGGWVLPAAIAVAVATGYVDPTLFAAEAGATSAGTAGGLTASEMATLTALAPETGTAIGASAAGATGAGLTAAELATLTESSALADSAMIGAEGLTAGEVGGGAITSAIPETPISQYELSPKFDLSPNVPIESVSPEFDPTGSLYTPEPAPYYDASPFSPVEQVSPELDPTGSLANTGITGKNVLDTLRAANTVKNVVKALTPQEQALKNAQTSQQQMNMANMLRGTQMAQTALPSIYKQANPFNFGQQNQPVQDTNALANLLRTA